MFLPKTRLAALPLRLETGRYDSQNKKDSAPAMEASKMLKMRNTLSFFCPNYQFLRQKWLTELDKPPNFFELITNDKFKLIFNKPENVKITAQYIVNCSDIRSKIIFQETWIASARPLNFD